MHLARGLRAEGLSKALGRTTRPKWEDIAKMFQRPRASKWWRGYYKNLRRVLHQEVQVDILPMKGRQYFLLGWTLAHLRWFWLVLEKKTNLPDVGVEVLQRPRSDYVVHSGFFFSPFSSPWISPLSRSYSSTPDNDATLHEELHVFHCQPPKISNRCGPFLVARSFWLCHRNFRTTSIGINCPEYDYEG